MSFLHKQVGRACFVGALCLVSTYANAVPQNGWWWNPNESGRGFFLEMRGGVLYFAGYFYENDGRATWLSSGGPVTDPYLYQGTLQRYRDGQTLFGTYHAPGGNVDVGPVTLAFTDDAHGTITWPGGTIAIEREIFGTGDAPFQPHTGWWWSPDESGRGFSVEVQGPNIFIVAFMYDDAGNPVWYFSAGPMSTPTKYQGEWLQFAGGQTMAGPYQPPGTPTLVGHVTMEFAGEEDATLIFTDLGVSKSTAPEFAAKAPRIITLPPQKPQLPQPNIGGTRSWPNWEGTYSKTITTDVPGYHSELAFRYKLGFVLSSSLSSTIPAFYDLEPGSTLRVWLVASLPGGCFQSADATFQLSQFSGALLISSDGTYTLNLDPRPNIPETIPFVTSCPGAPPVTQDLPIYTTDDGRGDIVNYYPYPGIFGPPRNYVPLIKEVRPVHPTGVQDVWIQWELTPQ